MAIQTITVNGETYRLDYEGLENRPLVQAATSSELGVVRPDGTTIVVDEGGVLSLGLADANEVSY